MADIQQELGIAHKTTPAQSISIIDQFHQAIRIMVTNKRVSVLFSCPPSLIQGLVREASLIGKFKYDESRYTLHCRVFNAQKNHKLIFTDPSKDPYRHSSSFYTHIFLNFQAELKLIAMYRKLLKPYKYKKPMEIYYKGEPYIKVIQTNKDAP
jgi:hypothetical protein